MTPKKCKASIFKLANTLSGDDIPPNQPPYQVLLSCFSRGPLSGIKILWKLRCDHRDGIPGDVIPIYREVYRLFGTGQLLGVFAKRGSDTEVLREAFATRRGKDAVCYLHDRVHLFYPEARLPAPKELSKLPPAASIRIPIGSTCYIIRRIPVDTVAERVHSLVGQYTASPPTLHSSEK